MGSLLFSWLKRQLVDNKRSNSYFVQNGKYYYIEHGNRLVSGKKQLKNVSGSLLVLTENLAMDQNTVYYKSYPQPNVDRNTFVVSNFVKKDKRYVYDWDFFRLKAVAGADPATFEYQIIDPANIPVWARDANRYFVSHQAVDVEYDSFVILNLMLAYDVRYVYIKRGADLSRVANTTGAVKKITKHFCADDEFVYYYSFKKGFQKIPYNIGIAIVKEDEIMVDDIAISVYR